MPPENEDKKMDLHGISPSFCEEGDAI